MRKRTRQQKAKRVKMSADVYVMKLGYPSVSPIAAMEMRTDRIRQGKQNTWRYCS